MAQQPKITEETIDRSVRRVFSSLRLTWERLYRAQSRQPEFADAARIKGVLLALENVRLMMPRPVQIDPPRRVRADLLQFLTGLRELVANRDFQQYGRTLVNRLVPPTPGMVE